MTHEGLDGSDIPPIPQHLCTVSCPEFVQEPVSTLRRSLWILHRATFTVSAIQSGGPHLLFQGAEHMAVGFACLGKYQCANLRMVMLVDRKSTRLNSSHLGISYAVF